MCRLMFIIGATNTMNIKRFMMAAVNPMSVGNKDGFGYTAIRRTGDIFTERWLNNEEAFIRKSQQELELENMLGPFVKGSIQHTQQGTIDFSDVTSVMIHTRYATCGKGLDNVHPFVDNNNEISVVHNGVISNHAEFNKLNSTCDSEVLLTEYINRQIQYDQTQLEDLTNELKGYWAIGTTAIDNDGVRFIDIHRNNGSATLYLAFIEELGGIVICTRDTIINDTLKTLNWNRDITTYEVVQFVATRFNAIDGSVMLQHSWTPEVKTTSKTSYTARVNTSNTTFSIVSNKTFNTDKSEPSSLSKSLPLIYSNEDNYIDVKEEDCVGVLDDDYTEIELIQKLEVVEQALQSDELNELYSLPMNELNDALDKIINERGL